MAPLDSWRRRELGCTSLLGRDPARIRETRLFEIGSTSHQKSATNRSTRKCFIGSRSRTVLCALGFDPISTVRKLLLRNVVPLVSLQDILHDFGHNGKFRCINRLGLRLVGQGGATRGVVAWADSLDTGL